MWCVCVVVMCVCERGVNLCVVGVCELDACVVNVYLFVRGVYSVCFCVWWLCVVCVWLGVCVFGVCVMCVFVVVGFVWCV